MGGGRLVGRDAPLGVVRETLDAVHSAGGLLGVLGEPGVGKSALLAHAGEMAREAGFTVLGAQGAQSESHLPFASLHQLLQPLLPRIDRVPTRQADALLSCFGMSDSEANPVFASLAVLELLVTWSAEAPLLVALDDLHWFDQPSVDALSFVTRRIAGERIVVVATARLGEPLLTGDQPVTVIELTGLDDASSQDLLRTYAPDLAPALRARVLRQAGGNPLALLEFADALTPGRRGWSETDDDLPMTARLERAFVARADELDPAARAVLDVAALDDGERIGDVLAAARMTSGGPVELATVEPALAKGLLTVTGDTYEIPQPLIGSALRAAMSPSTRQRIHAALADVLATDSHRAIWHRAASLTEPDRQTAADLEQAAADARRRGAMSTALAWQKRAAALSPDEGARVTRLLGAAELGYELGRFSEVQELTARVADLPLGVRDRSRLTWLEGVFHDGSTSEPAEIRHLVGLATRATSDGDVDLALQLLIGAGRRVWWRDPGESVRDEIVRAAQAVPLPTRDPRLLAVLGLTESAAMTPIVLEHLQTWSADADGRPDLAGLLGIAAFCIGDHRRAIDHLSAPVDALRSQGRLSLLAEVLAIRAWAEINLGVLDASSSADEAMRLAGETGQAVWGATAQIAVALIQAVGSGNGGRSELLARAEQTALRMPNASSSLLAAAQLVRGISELGADRPEPAYGELHRVFVPTDPAFQRVQQVWTVSYLVDAAVRTGRRTDAGAVLESMEQLTGASRALGPMISLEYSRAVLADGDDAEDLFRTALSGAADPYPWHRARLELAFGSWLRRQRRVLDSRAPLRAARSTFDALGAHSWAQRADHELRATGERGWQSVSRRRELLSPQEAQIAELAAQGLSNREIGEQLFLSQRTVGSHLYRMFPKLGVTNRTQLAGALAGDAPAVI